MRCSLLLGDVLVVMLQCMAVVGAFFSVQMITDIVGFTARGGWKTATTRKQRVAYLLLSAVSVTLFLVIFSQLLKDLIDRACSTA